MIDSQLRTRLSRLIRHQNRPRATGRGQKHLRPAPRVVLSQDGKAWEPLWDGNLGILTTTGQGGTTLLRTISDEVTKSGGSSHSIDAKTSQRTPDEHSRVITAVSDIMYARYRGIKNASARGFSTVVLVINGLSLLDHALAETVFTDAHDVPASVRLDEILLLGNRVGVHIAATDTNQEHLWWNFPSVITYDRDDITTLCKPLHGTRGWALLAAGRYDHPE